MYTRAFCDCRGGDQRRWTNDVLAMRGDHTLLGLETLLVSHDPLNWKLSK